MENPVNDHIRRIKTIDEQLKALDRIISSSEHLAAGLSISLSVGVPTCDEDGNKALDINLCSNTPAILDALKVGLLEARKERLIFASSDLRELQDFFAKTGAPA